MARENPSPSAPIRALSGTPTSERNTSQEGEAFCPIFGIGFPTSTPAALRSTRNRGGPLYPAFMSVLVKRIKKPATEAFVIHTFAPFRRYRPPRFTARVRIPATSEPAPGSVRAKQPNLPSIRRPRYFFLCFPV